MGHMGYPIAQLEHSGQLSILLPKVYERSQLQARVATSALVQVSIP